MDVSAEDRAYASVTPGAYLRQRLRDPTLNITQEALADAMQVSRATVSQIVNGRRSITADTAIRLARVLGTSAELWLGLQLKADLFEARHALGEKYSDLKPLQ